MGFGRTAFPELLASPLWSSMFFSRTISPSFLTTRVVAMQFCIPTVLLAYVLFCVHTLPKDCLVFTCWQARPRHPLNIALSICESENLILLFLSSEFSIFLLLKLVLPMSIFLLYYGYYSFRLLVFLFFHLLFLRSNIKIDGRHFFVSTITILLQNFKFIALF